MRPITIQEVELVVTQMEDGKALGPDGFTVQIISSLLGDAKVRCLGIGRRIT
jgi:hypothetical protein